METKFKKGNIVRIISHDNKKLVGKIGEVCEVIPVFKSTNESLEHGYIGKFSVGENTTAFYKVKVGKTLLKGYGMDSYLELAE